MKQPGPVLNERQKEILDLVCKGKRNKEMAYELGLSQRTIKWYISQLFQIYGVSNRTELATISQGRRTIY